MVLILGCKCLGNPKIDPSFREPVSNARVMPVVPARLDEQPSNATITGFGEAASKEPAAARRLAGLHAEIRHHCAGRALIASQQCEVSPARGRAHTDR